MAVVRFSGFPRRVSARDDSDFEVALRNCLFGMLTPEQPLISQSAKIASLGSCFAEEVSKALTAHGTDVVYMPMSERWNSAFAVDTFLAYVLDGVPLPDGFTKNNESVKEISPEQIRSFASADLFILTFGMSLCWLNKNGELILEPGGTHSVEGLKIAAKYDYFMQQTTVEQNEAAIINCISRIKRVRPNAPIVTTLSPVPMMGVMANSSAIPANNVSKATLRLALENVRQRGLENVYYWPSYDLVNWYGNHIERAFGDTDRDARHVRQNVIDLIVEKFAYYFIAANKSP